jgi:hypothetical protein
MPWGGVLAVLLGSLSIAALLPCKIAKLSGFVSFLALLAGVIAAVAEIGRAPRELGQSYSPKLQISQMYVTLAVQPTTW